MKMTLSVLIIFTFITIHVCDARKYGSSFQMTSENLFSNEDLSYMVKEGDFLSLLSCAKCCHQDEACLSFGSKGQLCFFFKLKTTDQVGNVSSGERCTFFVKQHVGK